MRFSILFAALLACAAEKYSATGLVLRVDEPNRTVLVSCEAIAGHMDAKTISVSVHDARELAGLAPGLMVEFTLTLPYATNIHVRKFEDLEQQGLSARRLKIVEDLDSPVHVLKIGESVPSAVLMDQDRKELDVGGFEGKVVLMNFFYSHCPLPDYCFRLSNNLSNVQRRFHTRMGRDLILLSVTFDPIHDQPEVLAKYAGTWKAGPDWHFLTGDLSEIQRFSKMFGVDAWPDETELLHSLHTVIIDRQKKLAANLEGNEFTARQLGDLVETILDPNR
jgi:protein SCO1/2